MINVNEKKEFSILEVIVLILIPATMLTATYIFIGLLDPPIPSILLFCLLAVPFLLIFEIAVVLCASKKETEAYSLGSAFGNYEKMGIGKIIAYGAALFVFAGVMYITIAPLETKFWAPVSNSLAQITPEYFNWGNNVEILKQYPKSIILLTCFAYFFLNVIGQAIEELFFRGYITSKISRFGYFAPLIITVLFSLYHFWLPFGILFRICVFLPISLVAWKKKNIYIAIVAHGLCNLFPTIFFIISVCL